MVRQSFEGTWEEITRHAAELTGRRVRLTVLEDSPNGSTPAPEMSLAEALKDYVGAFSSATPHNDSENVKELWGQYVEEKHQKREPGK